MTPQAQLATLAIMPIVLYLFKRFPAQQAVVIGFVGTWCFLPERADFNLPIVPAYGKISATSYAILLATFLFESERLSQFKFGWLDIFILLVCFVPFASSVSNGLGLYDGLVQSLASTVKYGIPYFTGRLYLNDLKGMRYLAIGMLISGLIYIPLCLYEGRFYAEVHRMVYGYSGNKGGFLQALRAGGYRPTVFMRHGLSVGMWMMATPLIAIWLWQAGTIKKIKNIPMNVWVFLLLITHVLQKSTGAYGYMIYGLLTLFSAKIGRTALPLLILIGIISFYLYLGPSGNFSGERADRVVQIAADIAGADRAQSLEFRFNNEEILVEKAQQRMILGWGGWGRNRVYDYDWKGDWVDISVTDSLWIIMYGTNGIVGLIGVFGYSLVPALSFVFCYPAKTWFNPKVAPAAVIAVINVLYVLDCCLNDQFNPVFTLASGGIAGIVVKRPEKFDLPQKILKPSLNSPVIQGRSSVKTRKTKQQQRLSRTKNRRVRTRYK